MSPVWSAARFFFCCVATPGGTALAQAVNGSVLLTLEARGVQVYRCDTTAASPAWALDHPEADLLNAQQEIVGHHGAGPSWRLDDGSTVKAEVIEKTPARELGAVPWLLLRATGHQGAGVLASVETIRRTQTHGGVAPAQGCESGKPGTMVRVPYTATYTFYAKP